MAQHCNDPAIQLWQWYSYFRKHKISKIILYKCNIIICCSEILDYIIRHVSSVLIISSVQNHSIQSLSESVIAERIQQCCPAPAQWGVKTSSPSQSRCYHANAWWFSLLCVRAIVLVHRIPGKEHRPGEAKHCELNMRQRWLPFPSLEGDKLRVNQMAQPLLLLEAQQTAWHSIYHWVPWLKNGHYFGLKNGRGQMQSYKTARQLQPSCWAKEVLLRWVVNVN